MVVNKNNLTCSYSNNGFNEAKKCKVKELLKKSDIKISFLFH